MTVYFAYRYRETNTTEEYAPDWAYISTKIEIVVADDSNHHYCDSCDYHLAFPTHELRAI